MNILNNIYIYKKPKQEQLSCICFVFPKKYKMNMKLYILEKLNTMNIIITIILLNCNQNVNSYVDFYRSRDQSKIFLI